MKSHSDETTCDALLVVRCQLGERDAWAELVGAWQPRLWRFLLGMLGKPDVAEEALQSTWLRVVRSIGNLDDPSRFSSWLFTIARRTVTDRLRRQYREPVSEEWRELPYPKDLPPGDALLRHDLIEAGLERLHPRDREVVTLHYLDERSIDEIARICDTPAGTVKSRLHRGRGQLLAFMDQQNDPSQGSHSS